MKNLKRVLSLALSGIMLVGMMAVGASAVGTKDFTDMDEIQHTDAVNTMAALNIITGNPDGSYAPERTVTREEMAKMITVALNGGKDFTYGTKATPSYTDIKGTWAESYIEYCSSLGIIGGNGDGTFAPKAPVTGSAAAKMMLTAMGYDAAQAGMVGTPDWEINTNVLAGQKDLYKDLETINPSEPLSRDSAAQLIYNGVRATMVEYVYNAQTVNGVLTMVPQVKDKTHFVDGTEYKTTILTEKFDMVEAEGLLKGVSYVEAAGKEPEKFVYTIAIDETTDGKVTEAADLVGAGSDLTFKADPKDYSDLLGEQVNVLYKTENRQRVIYGVYSTSDTVVTATVGDLDIQDDGKKTIKIDGTSYNLDGKTETINYYTFANADFGTVAAGVASKTDLGDSTKVAKVSAVKFVCNSADGKMDYAIVTPATVGKVTYKGNSSITIGNGVGAYDLDDIEVDDDVKKGDWVVFTSANHSVKGIATAVPATVITGTVDAKKGTDIRVNGTWYKSDLNAEAPGINKDVTLIVVGSYYYDADATTETTVDDILFVADAVNKDTVGDGKVEAIVAFADGSTKTINISEVNGKTADVAAYTNYGTDGKVVKGAMYTYSVAKSGNYELTALKTGNGTTNSDRAGFEEFEKADAKFDCTDAKKPTVGDFVIADDAVVFVRSDESKKTTVITGKELKDWNLGKDGSNQPITEWGANGQALAEKVKGAMSAKVIALYSDDTAIPGSQGGKAYGLVLSNAIYVKENGTNYAEVTIWNGDEEITVKAEKIYSDDGSTENTPSAANVKTLKAALKGAFVEYEALANGNITALKLIGTNAALVSTYTDRDGDTTLGFVDDGDYSDNNTDADLTITNKTVIIYVNTKDTKGVTSGDYDLATETAIEGYFIRNVVYASEDNSKLDVMFVDVNSNLKTNKDTKTLADNTTTPTGVQIDEDNHILYLNSKTLAVEDLLSSTDAANKLVYTGLAAEITAKDTNLAEGDLILVVAEDGSSVTYSVKTGAKP